MVLNLTLWLLTLWLFVPVGWAVAGQAVGAIFGVFGDLAPADGGLVRAGFRQ